MEKTHYRSQKQYKSIKKNIIVKLKSFKQKQLSAGTIGKRAKSNQTSNLETLQINLDLLGQDLKYQIVHN